MAYDRVISALVEKLRGYPEVKYSFNNNAMTLNPPHKEGFEIVVHPEADGWVIYFGDCGFHEQITEPAEAIDFVGLGLSANCRLRELRGVVLTRVRLERLEDGCWLLVHEFGHLKWPTSLKRTERVLQNRVLV